MTDMLGLPKALWLMVLVLIAAALFVLCLVPVDVPAIPASTTITRGLP